jgi:hypothetical protein
MIKEFSISSDVAIERNGMQIYPPGKQKFKRLKLVKIILPIKDNMARFSVDRIPFVEIRHIDNTTSEPIFIFKLNLVHSMFKKFMSEGKATIVLKEKVGQKVDSWKTKNLEFSKHSLH